MMDIENDEGVDVGILDLLDLLSDQPTLGTSVGVEVWPTPAKGDKLAESKSFPNF